MKAKSMVKRSREEARVRIRRGFSAFLTGAAVVTLAAALAQTVVGQTNSPSAQSATPSKKAATTTTSPRTVWGHPDLQGIWSNDGIVVPFQRAKEFGIR
jgi:hypothetical protein